MVCHDTSPCSPHVDEGLESLLPCNIFETKSFKEDYYEYKEDMDSQEHNAMDEDSPHLIWMGVMTIGNLLKIPSRICPKKGVLIHNLLEVLLKIPSMTCPQKGVFT